MSRLTLPIAAAVLAALPVAVPAPLQAQPAPHQARQSSAERPSHFYIKGPNAPYKNQIRKLKDPLNANGAGK